MVTTLFNYIVQVSPGGLLILCILGGIGALILITAVFDLFSENSTGTELIGWLLSALISGLVESSFHQEEIGPINRYTSPLLFWFLFIIKIGLGGFLLTLLLLRIFP